MEAINQSQHEPQNTLRVQVAELCPETIRLLKLESSDLPGNYAEPRWQYYAHGMWRDCILNDPLSDLNACAEGFEKDAPLEYWRALSDITGAGGKSISLQQFRRIGLATAAQRCEAFVLISKPFGLKVNA